MKIQLMRVKNDNSIKRIGLRLVVIVFLITLLTNLPQGNVPTLPDIYKALIAALIAALLLLEKGEKENGESGVPISS